MHSIGTLMPAFICTSPALQVCMNKEVINWMNKAATTSIRIGSNGGAACRQRPPCTIPQLNNIPWASGSCRLALRPLM